MPAQIVVVGGPQAGAALWIEDEVLRFGGDAGCELALCGADLARHVFTLRYADGAYTLFNRGTTALRLASNSVASGSGATWRRGGRLELPGGTVLVLETSGDGAPARRAAPGAASPTATFAAEAEPVAVDLPTDVAGPLAAGESTTGQALLVGLLFAAAVAILLMDDPQSGGAAADAPQFPEVLAALKASTEVSPDLWIRLDEAYALDYRGRTTDAPAAYRRLRDRLELEKLEFVAAGKPVPPIVGEVEAFVKRKLAEGSRSTLF